MAAIGYNINLGGLRHQTEQAQRAALGSRADCHLLMTVPPGGVNQLNDTRTIDDWAAVLESRIVWRTYSTLEGDWSRFPPNEEIVRRWVAEDRPQYIRDDPANEPGLAGGDPGVNEAYVASRTDLLKRAADAGIRVAVGAFSVGTPHEGRIDDGTYDPLIRAVVEGGHYFSVHEYCPGIPGAGDVFSYDLLLNPQNAAAMMAATDRWPLSARTFLLRRSDRFVLRARELGLADPQVIVTEAFVDNIPDAAKVLNQLRPAYGLPQYNYDMRGMLSWRNYYTVAFGTDSHSEQMRHLTAYVAEKVYYPGHIKGVCLFSLNWNWDEPEGHNILNPLLDWYRIFYVPIINQENQPMVTMPADTDSGWEQGTLTANGLNVRAQPTTNSDPPLTTIRGTFEGYRHSKQVKADGWVWQPVRFVEDGETIRGWVASSLLDFVSKPAEPTDPPAPPAIEQQALVDAVKEALSPAFVRSIIQQDSRFVDAGGFTMTLTPLQIEALSYLLEEDIKVRERLLNLLRNARPASGSVH